MYCQRPKKPVFSVKARLEIHYKHKEIEGTKNNCFKLWENICSRKIIVEFNLDLNGKRFQRNLS